MKPRSQVIVIVNHFVIVIFQCFDGIGVLKCGGGEEL